VSEQSDRGHSATAMERFVYDDDIVRESSVATVFWGIV
jgi:hypothetical protein